MTVSYVVAPTVSADTFTRAAVPVTLLPTTLAASTLLTARADNMRGAMFCKGVVAFAGKEIEPVRLHVSNAEASGAQKLQEDVRESPQCLSWLGWGAVSKAHFKNGAGVSAFLRHDYPNAKSKYAAAGNKIGISLLFHYLHHGFTKTPTSNKETD
jgi:hypothetical protein